METDFEKFRINPMVLLQPERPGYFSFVPAIDAKSAIRSKLESDQHLQSTLFRASSAAGSLVAGRS